MVLTAGKSAIKLKNYKFIAIEGLLACSKEINPDVTGQFNEFLSILNITKLKYFLK